MQIELLPTSSVVPKRSVRSLANAESKGPAIPLVDQSVKRSPKARSRATSLKAKVRQQRTPNTFERPNQASLHIVQGGMASSLVLVVSKPGAISRYHRCDGRSSSSPYAVLLRLSALQHKIGSPGNCAKVAPRSAR